LIETGGAAFIFPDSGTSQSSGAREWFEEGNTADVNGLCEELRLLVSQVVKKGTPAERIIIGGLGNGGSAAIQVGVRLSCFVDEGRRIKLGGVFSIGGGVVQDCGLWNLLEGAPAGTPLPPMLLCHGKDDPEVPFALGKASADRMCALLEPRQDEDNEDSFAWFPYKGSRHDGGVRRLALWINASLQHSPFAILRGSHQLSSCYDAAPPLHQDSSLEEFEMGSERHESSGSLFLSEDVDAEVNVSIFDSISQEIDASISDAISSAIFDALDEQREEAMESAMERQDRTDEQSQEANDRRLAEQTGLSEQAGPERECGYDNDDEERTHGIVALAIGSALSIVAISLAVKAFIARRR
jgi:hypothetical protein